MFDALIISAVIVGVCGWALGLIVLFWRWTGKDPSSDPIKLLLASLGLTGKDPQTNPDPGPPSPDPV